MGDVSVTVLAVSQAAEEGGQNFLLPNGTFFFVLIIFLIVLGVIGTFVVPPISRVLRERDAMAAKTVEDNRRTAEQLTAAEADYEEAMAEARREASGARDEARAEGRQVLEEMRARAGGEASQALQNAGDELSRQGHQTAAELQAAIEQLSATLASRVLGTDITTSPAVSGQRR